MGRWVGDKAAQRDREHCEMVGRGRGCPGDQRALWDGG